MHKALNINDAWAHVSLPKSPQRYDEAQKICGVDKFIKQRNEHKSNFDAKVKDMEYSLDEDIWTINGFYALMEEMLSSRSSNASQCPFMHTEICAALGSNIDTLSNLKYEFKVLHQQQSYLVIIYNMLIHPDFGNVPQPVFDRISLK